MSLIEKLVSAPRYVLKSGNQSIYPTIKFDDPNMESHCIYGFSDKQIYDRFIEKADQILTPYPLVNGYLSNQIAELVSAAAKNDCLGLVILDATDAVQPKLSAATMATVLLARQAKMDKVSVEYELEFDTKSASYLIQSSSPKMRTMNA